MTADDDEFTIRDDKWLEEHMPKEEKNNSMDSLFTRMHKDLIADAKKKHDREIERTGNLVGRILSEGRHAEDMFLSKEGVCEICGLCCSHPKCQFCVMVTSRHTRMPMILSNLIKRTGAMSDWGEDDENEYS